METTFPVIVPMTQARPSAHVQVCTAFYMSAGVIVKTSGKLFLSRSRLLIPESRRTYVVGGYVNFPYEMHRVNYSV